MELRIPEASERSEFFPREICSPKGSTRCTFSTRSFAQRSARAAPRKADPQSAQEAVCGRPGSAYSPPTRPCPPPGRARSGDTTFFGIVCREPRRFSFSSRPRTPARTAALLSSQSRSSSTRGRGGIRPMDQELIASLVGASIGLFVCCTACIVCRIWRRNRYYKKVQKSLDEEEAAFQE